MSPVDRQKGVAIRHFDIQIHPFYLSADDVVVTGIMHGQILTVISAAWLIACQDATWNAGHGRRNHLVS